MKNKAIVALAVAVGLVAVVALVMMAKPGGKKPAAPVSGGAAVKGVKAAAGQKTQAQKAPAQKVIVKDMGALTVKLTGVKNNDINIKGSIFRIVDARSSVFYGFLTTNRMQSLPPGNYDIVIDTAPAMIRKNLNIAKGRETLEDLGKVTGIIDVKMAGFSKKVSPYQVKVLQEKSGTMVVGGVTGKPIEVISGTYDIQVESMPRHLIKGVRVEAGKETPVDAGAAGALRVKAVDESGKESKAAVRVRKSAGGEFVTSWTANRSLELLPGTYDLDIGPAPVEARKDVKVVSGEETVIEVTVKAPPAPAAKAPAPAAPAVPAKK